MAQIQTENNPVFHPNHYNWIPGIECIEVVEHFEFNLGSAIKYIWRAPTRDPFAALTDLRKAIFLIQRQIDSMEALMVEVDKADSFDAADFANRLNTLARESEEWL